MRPLTAAVILTLAWPLNHAHAGLYYSDEKLGELPSQWTGFLIDLRALRNVASPATSARRTRYQQEARALESRRPSLSASELADLGALYIRLAEVTKAISLLRDGERSYPADFHIAANLGT